MCLLYVRKESILGDSEREKSLMFLSFSLPANFFSFFSLVTADVVGAAVQNSFTVCVLHTHTHAVTFHFLGLCNSL